MCKQPVPTTSRLSKPWLKAKLAPLTGGLQKLEPDDGKLSCPDPRGIGHRNGLRLPYSEAQLRKGDRSWEGSVERNREPMYKNQIQGDTDQGEQALDCKAFVDKER